MTSGGLRWACDRFEWPSGAELRAQPGAPRRQVPLHRRDRDVGYFGHLGLRQCREVDQLHDPRLAPVELREPVERRVQVEQVVIDRPIRGGEAVHQSITCTRPPFRLAPPSARAGSTSTRCIVVSVIPCVEKPGDVVRGGGHPRKVMAGAEVSGAIARPTRTM